MDIDYFYAQVEILKNAGLKGVPLIVGNPRAKETNRGVVLTCSYEARVYGIRSGMSMNEALQRCPDATIVKSNYAVYREASKNIMDILISLKLPMRIAGSDEAYMDITSAINEDMPIFPQLEDFAKSIKTKILEKEGLTVSVGIGPTLRIAKIASEYEKPDGITVVLHEQLESFFKKLLLIKIPGIGSKTAERLKKKGYEKCEDLLYKSEAELIQILGSWGGSLFKVFQGKTTNRILPRGQRKSISNERTFISKPGELDKYEEIINKLFEITHNRLVKDDFLTRTVDLKIRYNDFTTLSRSKSILIPTQSKEVLYKLVLEVVSPYLEDDRGLRLLGVGFSNLEKIDKNQAHLDEWFEDYTEDTSEETAKPKSTKALKSLDEWFDS
jgi:DNA polymerase IV (DinB-like DNA polymerase)